MVKKNLWYFLSPDFDRIFHIISGLIMAMGGFLMGVTIIEGIVAFCVFLISFFMIYSVLSHFFILRKMKQHSKDIINSVMTGKKTSKYDWFFGW